MLDPALGSDIVVHFLYPLKNAEEYHNGEVKSFGAVGIKAVEEMTLVFELAYPSASFLTQISYFFPLSVADFPEDSSVHLSSRWGTDGIRVSNGAFTLKSWVTNESIVLEKNPNYWDHERVKLDAVHIYPIADVAAEERAFRSGQLHITSKVPPGRVAWYIEANPTVLRTDQRLGLFFLQLNHNVDPLQKTNVRLALAKSIDREQLVDLVLKDGKEAASWFLPPKLSGRTRLEGPLGFDVVEARRLLNEAGYPGGVGFPKLTFLINTSEIYQALAEAIQYMWSINLGIEVSLESKEWKTFLTTVESRDYEIARYGYVPLYPDAYPLLNILTSGGTENFTAWSNESFDSYVNLSRTEGNRRLRTQIFRDAENLLLSDCPVIPIFFYNSVYLIHPSVEGWYPDLMDRHPLKYVSISPGHGASLKIEQ
jgi:oligopeptide transport system substrate-binding protein